jgi:hypothetical protein
MNRRNVLTLVASVILTTLVVAIWSGIMPGFNTRVAMAGGVRSYSLLAETMQPIDSSIQFDNTYAFLKTTQNSALGSTSYIGQLDLPDNARIISVRCFGRDSDPNNEFYFRLYRYNLFMDPVWSGVSDYAYSGMPYAGGNVVVEAPIDPGMAMVNNADFSYGIFLVLPVASTGELGVLRCVVDTTYSVQIPLVINDSP